MGGVAIKYRRVTSRYLSGMVEDDDLSIERCDASSGVILGVRADVTTPDLLG